MGCRPVASHSASGKSPPAPHGHGRRAECLPPLQHHRGSLYLCARDLSAERLQAPTPLLQCPTSARANSGRRAPAPYSAAAVRLQPLWSPPSDRPALDLQFPHHFPPSEMTNQHTWLRRSCPYGGQSAGEDGARREEGPGSLLGTAGGISVKPEGSFAKSTMLTRSEPSISAIQRPRAARDVAFCGGRAWTPVSYCRDSVSAELKGLIVCQNMLLGHQ
jgi:hypothetical protein